MNNFILFKLKEYKIVIITNDFVMKAYLLSLLIFISPSFWAQDIDLFLIKNNTNVADKLISQLETHLRADKSSLSIDSIHLLAKYIQEWSSINFKLWSPKLIEESNGTSDLYFILSLSATDPVTSSSYYALSQSQTPDKRWHPQEAHLLNNISTLSEEMLGETSVKQLNKLFNKIQTNYQLYKQRMN